MLIPTTGVNKKAIILLFPFTFCNYILVLIYKALTLGAILYVLCTHKPKIAFRFIDKLIILFIIYETFELMEIMINNFLFAENPASILHMSSDNIPNKNNNNDYGRLISTINAAIVRKPVLRAAAITAAATANILLDIVSDEARANYWIDQYAHYQNHGRLRGGRPGAGPFERGFLDLPRPGQGSSNLTSNSTSDSNPILDYIFNLFSPVEHSIPLETLISMHTILSIGLFILVIFLIIVTIYFYLNLLIIFNKDYILNRFTNKYILMYIKYVLFKSRLEIAVLSFVVTAGQCFIAYILYFLIQHPIIIN